jgi:c-di-GMP-binding flagellar brake protein YcgR
MKIEYAAATSLLPEMRVEVEVMGGEWTGVYATRVASVAGRDVTLEAPIRDGVFVPLRPATPLLVRALSPGGILSFDSEVIGRAAGPPPVVVVARPPRLLVVQRRDSFRVLTRLPVLFDRAAPASLTDARETAGVTVNLSCGGAALRSSLPLTVGDRLRIRLPLAGNAPGNLRLAAEVVGTTTRRVRFDVERVARLRFEGLSLAEENQLSRLVRTLENRHLSAHARSSLDRF